ncbi:MAG: efflux RND transporter periplasmic adaptor subunit [Terriglobales bacterium]|jgi:RND family efflux transporter MFP subunit
MIQKSRKLAQLFLLAMLAGLLVGLSGCNSGQPQASRVPEIANDFKLLTVRKTMVPDYTEATGTVRAVQSAQLASQVMGAITLVHVHEGDRVRRGEVLVTIDAAQQRAAFDSANAGLSAAKEAISAADADYALAEATMRRYQGLFDKKSVSPQEYDEVKTRLAAARARRDGAHAGRAQAEAAVANANSAVGFTTIRAPFDGLILAKLADTGAMAAPGVPMLMIEDPSRFRLEALLDESQISSVRLGATVPVVIDSLGNQKFTGKVVQIVPVADPASRTFTVKIELPANPQVRSGLFGRALFPRGEHEAILVPQNSLLHRGQLDAVYVAGKDRVAGVRYVTLAKASDDEVEVLSGLGDGEMIVVQPGGSELSGKQIGVK